VPGVVHVQQRLQCHQQSGADQRERGNRAALSRDDHDRDHRNDRQHHQPASALPDQRRPGQQAGGAQQQPAQRRGHAAPPAQDRAGEEPQHPERNVGVGVADRLCEARLVEVLDAGGLSRDLDHLDQRDCRDAKPERAQDHCRALAADRPERAEGEHERVEQRAVARVPRELLLARPHDRQQRPGPVPREQQHGRQRGS
jgi:hypothetical protein